MPDITMCTNGDCTIKESCYRFRAIPSPWQSFSHFTGGDSCDHYILVVKNDRIRALENPWDTDNFNNNTNY